MLGLIIAMAAQAAVSDTPSRASCAYDRDAQLALDQRAFDQDMTGGWRALAQAGCDLPAADLIHDWRVAHDSSASILYWHEGQLRAIAGQDDRAIALFEKARKPAAEDVFGWNLYVDGSIAFLRRDLDALKAARSKLAALPRPADLKMVGPDGKPVEIEWPMNLNVLDGFLRCWGRPYKEAYACPRSARPTPE